MVSGPAQADKRLRPLALLRRKTLRPPTVFIRRRNPWVLLRFIRCGLNVGFIVFLPENLHAGGIPARRQCGSLGTRDRMA